MPHPVTDAVGTMKLLQIANCLQDLDHLFNFQFAIFNFQFLLYPAVLLAAKELYARRSLGEMGIAGIERTRRVGELQIANCKLRIANCKLTQRAVTAAGGTGVAAVSGAGS